MDKLDAGHERRKRQTVFFGGGYADGAEGAAVKGVLHGQDAVLGRGLVGRVGGGAGAEAGEFQGAVGGFGSAVGGEDAVHARDFRELAGGRTPEGGWVEG